uniref:Uncharacterized protein n=1 Tax=Anguilla anguilla TaxID=7936 RepID=A0A0E9V3J8_ANGAN
MYAQNNLLIVLLHITVSKHCSVRTTYA